MSSRTVGIRGVHALTGLCLAAFGTACASPPPPPEDSATVRSEIEEAFTGYREAALAGDVDRMLAYLTEDFRIQEPGVRTGRSEMADVLRSVFEDGGEVLSFDVRRDDLFVHGDAAYEIGEYDEALRLAEDEMELRGNYFIRWERGEDDRWRMDRVVIGPREAPPM